MVVGLNISRGMTPRFEVFFISKGKCTACGKQLSEERDGIFLCKECQGKQKGEN